MRLYILSTGEVGDQVFLVVRAQTPQQAQHIGRSAEGRKHLDFGPVQVRELPIGGPSAIVWWSWTEESAQQEATLPDMPNLPPIMEEHGANEETLVILSSDITRFGLDGAEELARQRREGEL